MERMRYIPLLLGAALAMATLAACDEGDIPPKTYEHQATGQAIHLTGHLQGVGSWSDQYQVALAAFGTNTTGSTGNYSMVQRAIIPAMLDSEGNIDITLENVVSPAATVELCVTNLIRQRVVSFATLQLSDYTREETIEWNIGQMDLGIFTAIQDMVFNQFCVACHGSGGLAAGLSLKPEDSYANLVRVPSSRVENGVRVIPNRASASVLYQVLNGRSTSRLNGIHGNIIQNAQDVSSETLTNLITDWINDGAKP